MGISDALQQEREEQGLTPLLKWSVAVIFVVTLGVLLFGGTLNYSRVPPYPSRVVVPGPGEERVVIDGASIKRGQEVYQKYGLMDQGTVWGHGTQRAMDFSAHTLHLLGQNLREELAQDLVPRSGLRASDAYGVLGEQGRILVDALAIKEMRENTYDPATGAISISPARAAAWEKVADYWHEEFSKGDATHGFLPNTVHTPQERADLASFFFWTAWVAGTNRPGQQITYTNNWPPDRSVGNDAPDVAIFWSFAGIVALLAVLGFVVHIIHRYRFFYISHPLTELATDLSKLPITSSQRKTAKYFLVVAGLFIAQIMMGGLLAHYTVHPASFYAKWVGTHVPYAWAKSWHLQLAIFWIAVSWVAAAIYLAPLIGKREPKGQGLLVDLLFVAILLVAGGSLIGEVFGILGKAGSWWFWLGHQGWEYLELGRLWQILLFLGLIFWLVIAYRGMAPALREERDRGGLVHFYTYSAVLIVLFFGFGFFYGPQTHLTIADYWRWFVVHLWVEGIFEFFAVAATALLLAVMGLVTVQSALRAAYLTAGISLLGGIIGTAHHYFWFGAPSFWLALGAVFSSLEPIPLITLAARAWMEHKAVERAGKDYAYRWPFYFLTASAFWNFLGAGVFGFAINLPIVNYYEHGTYLTSNHGHTALFGTYGMLSVALSLFVWRGLVRPERWNDRLLSISFWGLNGGLLAMSLLTLLPVGVLQLLTTYHEGLWAAKNATFFARPDIQFLGNARIVPDSIIILFGAVPLGIFFLINLWNLKPTKVNGGETLSI